MKIYQPLILRLLACLALGALAVWWAAAWWYSLSTYRSPLHAHPPAPGQPAGAPLTRRVVFVLVDALRLDTSLEPQVMPFLNELRQQGASAWMHSKVPSYSQPGYSVLLTGAWPDLSDGPAVNVAFPDIPTFTQDNLFSAAHRAGLKTAISGFYWFEKLIPQAAVDASFYTQGEDRSADRQVVEAALPYLQDGGYQLVLIHLDQVDYAGHHEGGPRSPNWNAAARRSDDLLREIAAPLDLSRDTLFVCSDHGQVDPGGHGGQDPIVLLEPFVMAGAGVRPGNYGEVFMTDVAPTLAVLLGEAIPASSQGRVLTDMLALDPGRLDPLEKALEEQQKRLAEAYQSAIGADPAALPGIQDPLLTYQFALETARYTRLNAERLPHLLMAVLAAGLLAFFPYRTWRRDQPVRKVISWSLAGAALYLLFFNLQYVWLGRRAYSLSYINDAAGFLIPFTGAVLIAFALSWLAFSFGLGSFHQEPRRAAELSLDLGLATLFLLTLPALWSFALNGITTTWTLPDIASSSLALFSLAQALMVALFSLAFAGLAALWALLNRRNKADPGLKPA